MAEKQALNATFFAFKRRERGGVLTLMTIAYLALAALIGGAFLLINAQGILAYLTWIAETEDQLRAAVSDPAGLSALTPPASVMALGPMYLLFLLAFYVLLAAYEAGCLRWMIRGERGGLFGLSLGADTWRVYFGYWVWFFLSIGAYLGFVIVVFAVAAVGGAAAGESGVAATIIAAIVLGVAYLLGWLYFAVRFAPAAATSVAKKRFAFFDAWTVTRGRFWALFGAFVLLFLIFMGFYIAATVAFTATSTVAALNALGYEGSPESAEDAFRAFADPQFAIAIVIFVAVMTIASMLLYLAMYGVNARAAVAALEEGKIKAAA